MTNSHLLRLPFAGSSDGKGERAVPVDPIVVLAVAASGGDKSAEARLLEALADDMASAVRAIMGREHPDLDDVVQQSLIALLRALPLFRGDCYPRVYASRIAVRTALRARRRARHYQGQLVPIEEHEDQADDRPTPSEELRSHQRCQLIHDLLGKLPEEQAESLALRVVLGRSMKEVASATGAPLNTVRSRIRLAKEALLRKIEAVPGLAEELKESS